MKLFLFIILWLIGVQSTAVGQWRSDSLKRMSGSYVIRYAVV